MRPLWILTSLAILGLTPASSRADSMFGDFQRLPDQIDRGFSVGFDFGGLVITGAKGTVKNPGFGLNFTTGYDLFDYLTIEGVYAIGISEADPITLSGGVNSFNLAVAAKAQYPMGRLYPFVEVGPGIFFTKPNFPGQSDKNLSILIAGGAEYYTYLRHYSLYLKASYEYVKIPIDAIMVSLGLKYTF